MKNKTLLFKHTLKSLLFCGLTLSTIDLGAQTLAFPEATGFGRYTTGARGAATPQIYLVTNLNDSGPGSFRDAVSQPGRFVIFKVGGIINLQSVVAVPSNTTIAGQTAPGEGIVFLGARVSYSGANNTISRYVRHRYGGTSQNQDASGIANGANIILDHLTFTWGTDEVFSVNWDNNGVSPDNITIQNSIIGQGMHRHNHSAGGLMQPPPGGKISLIGNLYICNKTRNNKIKGINEFVNNVVYNWGNYGNTYGHTQSGEAYIMGGDSAGSSFANIINNYFIGGPNTSPTVSTPFSVGNANFNLYGPGNYFDNNKNGILDGTLVPQDLTGFPTGDAASILSVPYDYPVKNPVLTAQGAYDKIITGAGASYPRRDQVDQLMISDLMSKGTTATYVYVQTDLTTQFGFTNGGAGHVYGAPAPLDTDNDGMPDAWETANGLNPNVFDALAVSSTNAPYLNIEVYINNLPNTVPPDFIIPPSNLNFTNALTGGTPAASSLTVNWSENAANETNYVLERSPNGTAFTVVATLPANTTSYNETGLTPNTQYYYRVKAVNAADSSVYTANATVTTPPVPSAPTQATSPNPSNGNVNVQLDNGNLLLKWTGSANTTSYTVHFGTNPLNLNNVATVPYSATPSYQISNLNTATNYYWRIDATNALGTTTGVVWNFKAITPTLVGSWPFAEAPLSGTQIADVTPYANHGVLNAAYDNASVRVPGKENNALDLATSPNTPYIASIPHQDQILFNNNSFTVSYWMKAPVSMIPSSSATSLYVLCKGSFTANTVTGATGKRFNIEIKGGQLRYAIDDDVTKKEITSPIANYFTNNWVHVVIQRDIIAHKMRIYTNGVLSTEGDETAVTGIGEASDLIIGNIGELEFLATTNAPAPYKGAFDELKMYNYALSPTEISALYNQAVLGNAEFSISKNVGSVYPNPVKDQLYIKLPEYKKSTLTATVMDMTGKVIIKETLKSNGNGTFNLNISGRKVSGNYILNVSGDNLNSNFKIIVE
ncbi:fibronectin type III domain-containing protein [Chryseobacterium chendengshani]|uniref:LamG-like jellyroll fold domain-containing protein n=1 Tax=Chryseobacterium sp. LJ668 TaxID=2864040 RepID=UPI001C6910CC|nr:LamG-like jellyroll fold domain-containing protein [Chryseobacterium sp. LJ668]MBW8523648.1 fibronectin type III domain-containing protein [Chryseobacterium sp. LJ668]QYK15930.1 fibronectin type III domain-containing protein [Chryseobacterium sp. LJ668]